MDPGITDYGWFPAIVVGSAVVGSYRWARRKIGQDAIHNALQARAKQGWPVPTGDKLELFIGSVRAVCKLSHRRFSPKIVARLIREGKTHRDLAKEWGVEL